MKIKKDKLILIYTHSLYLKYSKSKYHYSLPLGEALFDEMTKRKYKLFWFFRNGSKLQNHNQKKIYTPFLTKIFAFLIKLDRLNKLFNYKLIEKPFKKSIYVGLFERLFWRLFLKFLKPSIIIGTEPSQELCTVARKLNIKTIDLEHGLRDDAYYFNKSYRYNNKGYPNYLFYSNLNDSLILKDILPKYVENIETGYLDLIYYEKEILNEINSNQTDTKTIIYASTYKVRGSQKPHDLPLTLVRKIIKFDINLIIRLHPKLATNQKLFMQSIKYLKNQLEKNKINYKPGQVNFSNPYKKSLLIDLSNANGLFTLNSSSYRYAKHLGLPVLVHSKEMNLYDRENHQKGLYGFKENLNNLECELFINSCLNNIKLSSNKTKKLVSIEKEKMLKALKLIEN